MNVREALSFMTTEARKHFAERVLVEAMTSDDHDALVLKVHDPDASGERAYGAVQVTGQVLRTPFVREAIKREVAQLARLMEASK